MVFLNILTHIRNKLLHALHEVGMNVSHHTANRVVVQNKTATTSFFKDVENLLTVTEGIKECCRCTEVLTQTAEEKNV